MRFEGVFTNLLNHPQLSAAIDERHCVFVRHRAEREDGRKQRQSHRTTLASGGFLMRPHQQDSPARSSTKRAGESLQRGLAPQFFIIANSS